MSGTGPTADEGLPGDKPQNSRDPLLVLVRFILIFLPGCTCPASAGLSLSGSGTILAPRIALGAEASFANVFFLPSQSAAAPHSREQRAGFLQHDCEQETFAEEASAPKQFGARGLVPLPDKESPAEAGQVHPGRKSR